MLRAQAMMAQTRMTPFTACQTPLMMISPCLGCACATLLILVHHHSPLHTTPER